MAGDPLHDLQDDAGAAMLQAIVAVTGGTFDRANNAVRIPDSTVGGELLRHEFLRRLGRD